MPECALDATEGRQPLAHLLESLCGDSPDAAAIGAVFERQQALDFLKRKAQRSARCPS